MTEVLRRRTKCRGCGREIAFIKTVNGKSIPVDPEPIRFLAEEENEKFVTADGEVKRGKSLDRRGLMITRETETGYRSHFATCPAADDFRKKNKKDRVRAEE